MKSLFRLLVLLILLTFVVVPLVAQNVTYVSPRHNSLNVRTGPGLEHGVIAEIFGSSQYPVLQRSATGNWLLIDLGSAQGWVHKAYVNEHTYSAASAIVPATTTASLGQGGGFAVPQATYTYTVPVYMGTASLGQGGGFAAPTTTSTGVNLSNVQLAGTFNSTVGSWVALNVRRGPSMSYGVVAIIPQGQRATPLGRNARGTWYFVDYNGAQGWVTHELVAVPPSIDVVALPVVSNE